MQEEDNFEEMMKIQQQFQQLEGVVKQVMTKEAIERYGNIKAANPSLAVQVIGILAQVIQSGQAEIDDQKFKQILQTMSPQKEFKITRK